MTDEMTEVKKSRAVKIFSGFTLAIALLAGLYAVDGLMSATSAPQQAAVAAIACAMAIIPYVITRSIEILEG